MFSEQTIEKIAALLEMPVVELERESLRAYLKGRLEQVQERLIELRRRYGVVSSEEMQRLYEQGKLKEEGTWEDFFRFDHLEAEQESLAQALESL